MLSAYNKYFLNPLRQAVAVYWAALRTGLDALLKYPGRQLHIWSSVSVIELLDIFFISSVDSSTYEYQQRNMSS